MDKSYFIQHTEDLFSPQLVFYKEKILQNIEKSIVIAGNSARLRPHVKTHKTKQIVQLCQAKGIDKFKCATIAEAEMLAQCNVQDVLIAYPLIGPNIIRFFHLKERYPHTLFSMVLDDKKIATEVSRLAESKHLQAELYIDIDPGLHRTGVPLGSEVIDFYNYVKELKYVQIKGFHCYDGHNHDPDLEKREIEGNKIYTHLKTMVQSLKPFHSKEFSLVLGGTPSFPVYAKYPEVEVSPGTCFLQDWNYLNQYKELDFVPAALVFSRVIGGYRTHSLFTLDLGYKGIASDPKEERGKILNWESSRSVFQNEEHWVFESGTGSIPEIGEYMYVLPTHICPTCALYDEAAVVDASGNITERWEIVARRRKLTV